MWNLHISWCEIISLLSEVDRGEIIPYSVGIWDGFQIFELKRAWIQLYRSFDVVAFEQACNEIWFWSMIGTWSIPHDTYGVKSKEIYISWFEICTWPDANVTVSHVLYTYEMSFKLSILDFEYNLMYCAIVSAMRLLETNILI